jgi:putative photosynthetic complex assembly protein 2
LRHFGHALMASLYHELAVLALASAVVALAWRQPNRVGVWTFVVLWWMHQSARVNVFLGVRNIDEQFLPAHMDWLRGFIAKAPMNFLFPVSVSVSTGVAVLLFAHVADAAAGSGAQAGLMLTGTLMVLAILEHWLLMLPWSTARLWNWGLSARTAQPVYATAGE